MEREAVVRAWHGAAVGACVVYGVVALSLALAERAAFDLLGLNAVQPAQVVAAGLLLGLVAPGSTPSRTRRVVGWVVAALLAAACAYMVLELFFVPEGGPPPAAASALPWLGLGALALLTGAGAALDGEPVRYRRPAGPVVAWSYLSTFALLILATLLLVGNFASWPLAVFATPVLLLFASPFLALGLAGRSRRDDTPGRAIRRCTLLLATAMAWTSVLAAVAWRTTQDADPSAWTVLPLAFAAAVAAAVATGGLGHGLWSLRTA